MELEFNSDKLAKELPLLAKMADQTWFQAVLKEVREVTAPVRPDGTPGWTVEGRKAKINTANAQLVWLCLFHVFFVPFAFFHSSTFIRHHIHIINSAS